MNPANITEQVSKPQIWNPNAAANWSVVFSPAFGAFLHAKNATILGRPEEAAANIKWFFGYLVFLGIVLTSILIPSIPDASFRLIGLILLLTWYFRLAKKQVRFVKDTYGADYQRKSWAKPLLVALGCLIGFLFMACVFGFIAVQIYGPTGLR